MPKGCGGDGAGGGGASEEEEEEEEDDDEEGGRSAGNDESDDNGFDIQARGHFGGLEEAHDDRKDHEEDKKEKNLKTNQEKPTLSSGLISTSWLLSVNL